MKPSRLLTIRPALVLLALLEVRPGQVAPSDAAPAAPAAPAASSTPRSGEQVVGTPPRRLAARQALTKEELEEKMNNIKYMRKYGYMEPEPDNASPYLGLEKLKAVVASFQRLVGLQVTGEFDTPTKKLMGSNRCGNNDTQLARQGPRRAKRANAGIKWRNNTLTWKLAKYPTNKNEHRLDRRQVLNAVREAFRMWSAVSGLSFVRVTGRRQADIEVAFVTGGHACNLAPFEGDELDLGHGQYPNMGGDVHLNDHKQFTTSSGDGSNLLQVATHEIGHALGLVHSWGRRDVMYPYYQGYEPDFKLSEQDIKEIQVLYGAKD